MGSNNSRKSLHWTCNRFQNYEGSKSKRIEHMEMSFMISLETVPNPQFPAPTLFDRGWSALQGRVCCVLHWELGGWNRSKTYMVDAEEGGRTLCQLQNFPHGKIDTSTFPILSSSVKADAFHSENTTLLNIYCFNVVRDLRYLKLESHFLKW